MRYAIMLCLLSGCARIEAGNVNCEPVSIVDETYMRCVVHSEEVCYMRYQTKELTCFRK